MSTATAETILTLIEQLSVSEQDKLRQLWAQQPAPAELQNGTTHKLPTKAPEGDSAIRTFASEGSMTN